jgi:pyruvate dehydrogenase E1 component alpha subunit
MDPVAVYEGVSKAVDRARKGEGPSLLEIKTYRYKGHSMSDAQHYRTKDEVAEYQKIDPITTCMEVILSKGYATEDEVAAIDKRVKERVNECVQFGEESPFPKAEELYENVYSQKDYPFITE